MRDRDRTRVRAGGTGPAWTPALLGGTPAEYDPSPPYSFKDIDGTQAAADGDPVFYLADKLGHRAAMTQPDGAGTYLTLKFSAGRYSLQNLPDYQGFRGLKGGFSLTGDSLIAVRARQAVEAGTGRRLVNSSTVNGLIAFDRGAAGNNVFVGDTVYNLNLATDQQKHTVLLYKASGGNWQLRVDGVQKTVSNVSTNWGVVCIGGPNGTVQESYLGDVYRLVVANLSPSGADIANLETYLGAI